MNNFDNAFAHIIGVEGGYSNNPADPGGETKYGICKRSYPGEDIKNMTLDRAKMIYRRDYWDKVKGDELPTPLDSFVFDSAVNQGVEPAIRMLQRTLGVAQDGIIGMDTMRKVRDSGKEACALFMAERALRYFGTRSFDQFGRGWLKRLFIVTLEA
jgi:lysozyme family protein